MIKLEHVVLPSPEQMEFVIEGMRNSHNSWDKSDSDYCGGDKHIGCINCSYAGDKEHNEEMIATDLKYGFGIKPCGKNDFDGTYCVGHNDLKLMKNLSKATPDERKFMRMMPVMVRITAPLYWWKEFDTYKVGTVANSCSTMHKITEKEFTLEDFSTEHLMDWEEDFTCKLLINEGHSPDGYPCGISPVGGYHVILMILNAAREKYLECDEALKTYGIPLDKRKEMAELRKQYWWQMIQLLPSSYNQTRNVMLNYEVLHNMYHSRKGHKLDEWRDFCNWMIDLPYFELITGTEAVYGDN